MRTPAWRAHRDAPHMRSATGIFVDLCEVPDFTLHCAPSFAPQRDAQERITILARLRGLGPRRPFSQHRRPPLPILRQRGTESASVQLQGRARSKQDGVSDHRGQKIATASAELQRKTRQLRRIQQPLKRPGIAQPAG